MCTGFEIFSLVAGAGSTYYSSQVREQEFELQAELATRQASNETAAAKIRADQIREDGKRRVSQARAALAAAGVNTDIGSSVAINKGITGKAEENAITTIDNAHDKATGLRFAAQISSLNADQEDVAGVVNAASSLTSSRSFSNWVSR